MRTELAGNDIGLLGLTDQESRMLLLQTVRAQRGRILQAVLCNVVEQAYEILDLLLQIGP